MTKEFTTATKRRKPIEFTVDGTEYQFTPPKQAGMVLDFLETGDELGAMMDWVNDGLGEDQAAAIEARLKDPDDDFDFDELTGIARWLVEETSGRPTKPPRASRRRR
jgi:hypothetical protein